MNRCLLCLESTVYNECCIPIHSTDWQNLNIENIIEMHLWSVETIKNSSHICETCWKELYSFHNFFKTIQNAHQNLNVVIKNEPCFEEYCDKTKLTETNCITNCPIEAEVLIIKSENTIDFFEKEEDVESAHIQLQQKRKSEFIKDKNDIFEEETEKSAPQHHQQKRTCGSKRTKKCKSKTVKNCTNEYENTVEAKSEPHEDTVNKSELTQIKDLSIKEDDLVDIAEKNKLQLKDKEKTYGNHLGKVDNMDTDNDEIFDNENSSHGGNKIDIKTLKQDEFISEHHQITCNLCQTPLETFSLMIKHFKEEHNQRGYVICCKRKFSYRTELVDHIQVHLNPEYFKCQQCDKNFASRSCLRIHVRKKHEGIKEQGYECDLCGKILGDKYRLKFHKLIHEAENQERLPCKECEKTFRNSFSLASHIRTVHLKKYSKVCDLCGLSITDKEKFNHHMLEHEGKPVPMLACEICGRRLADKKSLKRHMNSHHPAEGEKQESECQICSKKFSSLANVKKHIKDVHNNNYKYKCTICIKAFKRPDALKDHIARHTGTRIHTCGWCPKTFYSNGQMYAHRKNAHPKEWQESVREKFSGNLPDKYKILDNDT